jgi:hypothetical protein
MISWAADRCALPLFSEVMTRLIGTLRKSKVTGAFCVVGNPDPNPWSGWDNGIFSYYVSDCLFKGRAAKMIVIETRLPRNGFHNYI